MGEGDRKRDKRNLKTWSVHRKIELTSSTQSNKIDKKLTFRRNGRATAAAAAAVVASANQRLLYLPQSQLLIFLFVRISIGKIEIRL